MRYSFPSLDKPNERYSVYEMSSDNKGYNYQSYIISPCLSRWDTMGDGDTQHSPDYCPSNDGKNLLDFCRSVMGHLTKMPPEIFSVVNGMFDHHVDFDPKWIQFIQKTRYDEQRYHQYAQLQDCKKSTAESKQYDKRWMKIDSRWDGSYENVRSILYEADIYRHTLPLQSIWLDIQIAREFGMYAWSVAGHYKKQSHTIFSCLTDEEVEKLCEYTDTIAKYCVSRRETDRLAYCIERQAGQIAKAEVASA